MKSPKRKKPKNRARAHVKSKPTRKRTAKRQRARSSQITEKTVLPARQAGALSGMQSGDLQGISNAERADSESVDELIANGNAFEAGIVEGVEEAEDADGREVRTREAREDDVPQEYLDKD